MTHQKREVIGGLWYNTNNNNLYLYDGTTWTIVGGDAAVSTATLPLANPTTDNFKSNRPYLTRYNQPVYSGELQHMGV